MSAVLTGRRFDSRSRAAGPPLALAVVLASWLWGVPDPAPAAMVDCTQASAGAYGVFIDEPMATPAAFGDRIELLAFMDKLQWALQGYTAPGDDLSGPKVQFRACKGRLPAQDGSDFADSARIETLYNDRTVLEFWGSLDAVRQGGKRTDTSAQINYLLVPVEFAVEQNEAALSGILRLGYPEAGARRTADFVELLTRSQDIDALLAAALGYKALREQHYDVAHDSLCQSGVLLGKISTHLNGSSQKAGAQALQRFVLKGAGQAVSAAQADQRTPTAFPALKLLTPSAPCPGADALGGTPP